MRHLHKADKPDDPFSRTPLRYVSGVLWQCVRRESEWGVDGRFSGAWREPHGVCRCCGLFLVGVRLGLRLTLLAPRTHCSADMLQPCEELRLRITQWRLSRSQKPWHDGADAKRDKDREGVD